MLAENWIDDKNYYLCGNPVKTGVTGKPRAEDILEGRILLLDLDPIDERPTACFEMGRIADFLYKKFGVSPAIINSGRGAQGWLRVSGLSLEQRREVLNLIPVPEGFKLDKTYNLDRLMRMPGTKNQKTGFPACIILDGAGMLRSNQVVVTPQVAITMQAGAYIGGNLPPTAQAIWDSRGEDRSKRDWQYVLELLVAGYGESQIRNLLYGLPGGEAADERRDESYWESTVTSARRAAAEQGAVNDAGVAAMVELELKQYEDDALRYVQLDEDKCRWYCKVDGQRWIPVGTGEARAVYKSLGVDVAEAIADAVLRPWKIVYEPFKPEILPGRLWNHGPQLIPACEGQSPTWTTVLGNIGKTLTKIVLEDEWCQLANLKTGGDYLEAWVAAVIQKPMDHVPYLFLYGPENSGKSLFHEALALLFKPNPRGHIAVAEGHQALTSQGGFNGELASAVIVSVEELDGNDRRNSIAKNRLKNLARETF